MADGFNFWSIGVYEPSTDFEKNFFVQELHDLFSLVDENWFNGGDFNLIRWPKKNSNLL